jgi:adenylylsulfate kinase
MFNFVSALLLGCLWQVAGQVKSGNIKLHEGISREAKWQSVGHKGITLWMTGLSGSGKSTISVALEKALVQYQPKAYFVYRLDGDNLRFGLNRDLGFSPEDRKENVRRVSEVSRLFAEAGAIVIAGLISPYSADRAYAREVHTNASLPFMEVFVEAPLSTVEERDPKGLYKKARAGQIKGFTGIDAPYEAPVNPEVHLRTDKLSVVESVNKILEVLDSQGIHLQRSFRPLPGEESSACTAKKDEL